MTNALLLAVSLCAAPSSAGDWHVQAAPAYAFPVRMPAIFDKSAFSREHGTAPAFDAGFFWDTEEKSTSAGVQVFGVLGLPREGKLVKTDIDGDGRTDGVEFESDERRTILALMPSARFGGYVNEEEGGFGTATYLSVGLGLVVEKLSGGDLRPRGVGTTGQVLDGSSYRQSGGTRAYPGALIGYDLTYTWQSGFYAGASARFLLWSRPQGPGELIAPGLRLGYSF